MTSLRFAVALALASSSFAAVPASAQFFFKSHDMSGQPAKGGDTGITETMPGATDDELRAALLWNLRVGLNVAALQCQFEPTLMTVSNYNALLSDHKEELRDAFETVDKYFKRMNKTKKEGQAALDRFGTRTYSGFTTVGAQYGFCQTAGVIGRDALFTSRGMLGTLAEERMRELRNSLIPWGEQHFPYRVRRNAGAPMPRLDAVCWNKRGEWRDNKCGVQNLSRTATGITASNRTAAGADAPIKAMTAY